MLYCNRQQKIILRNFLLNNEFSLNYDFVTHFGFYDAITIVHKMGVDMFAHCSQLFLENLKHVFCSLKFFHQISKYFICGLI